MRLKFGTKNEILHFFISLNDFLRHELYHAAEVILYYSYHS